MSLVLVFFRPLAPCNPRVIAKDLYSLVKTAVYGPRLFPKSLRKWVTREWTQPLGFEHTAHEIMIDALKRALSLNKEKIRPDSLFGKESDVPNGA